MSSISIAPQSAFDKVFDRFSHVNSYGVRVQSQQEMAKAAVLLYDNNYRSLASVFATGVVGGSRRAGLFPDYNGDGGCSKREWATLAREDGIANSISNNDFLEGFDDAVPGGVSIDVARLHRIASGGRSTPPPPNPYYSGYGYGYGDYDYPQPEPEPQPEPYPTRNPYASMNLDSISRSLYSALRNFLNQPRYY